eukprot:CAMPEP_0174324204 /NCGR_PEP_ID=MMETSP0810-20121108/12334_1 /TAXON_ID=73025 ORGANISM="Eutreptiella gymnastica-like, Strain CCMP1594" /NCGR_SAMPLE_ID=MMETSP0810 /ASSEMBLY_ACC=CAM_ASM_000659 /LENGTH=461 /DNA_ID=CAMNT_0015436919 /DNA_START=20 /DNA_END=1405 /DNA_ORIENTATION=+
MPEFRKRVEAGNIWSLKIPQLEEIIKCLRDSYPSLGVSGNKGALVDRIQGVFRHQQPRETLQHNKVALKIQRPPIANVASAPYPQRFFVKQNVERKVVRSGRCLGEEESTAFAQICADFTLKGHQNPLNPISKLVDIVYVHNDISVTFELDPEDHEAVVQRTSRVHVVPLKMNLEPEGWLEQDMRLFVNKQWIEVLPKTWRNKNPRVHPFTTVLPLDITTYLSRADRRAEIQVEFPNKQMIQVEFPNKQMIWQGLLTVCVVGQRKVKELKEEICSRSCVPQKCIASQQEDDDVEMGDEEISLKCPITLASINIPAKGTQCTHKACFDLEMYLTMCNQQKVWNCPICEQQCSFSMLRVDALMDSVLKSVNTDVVSKITVKPDGTWTASAACNGATSSNGLHHSASNGSGGAPEPKSGAKSEAVCVDILSDDEPQPTAKPKSQPWFASGCEHLWGLFHEDVAE